MVDAVVVAEVLNGIVDPCSAAAGAPAGLVDMGLVGAIDLKSSETGVVVAVVILTTHPFCMMAGVFLSEAATRLKALDGVTDVVVTLDPSIIWTPDRMSIGYAATLRDHRAAARA